MRQPLPRVAYERNAKIYKLLANPKRLEILNLLAVREWPVRRLARIMRARMANVSQHLALLRQARLVSVRHSGSNAYYRIADPRIVEPCRILQALSRKNSRS